MVWQLYVVIISSWLVNVMVCKSGMDVPVAWRVSTVHGWRGHFKSWRGFVIEGFVTVHKFTISLVFSSVLVGISSCRLYRKRHTVICFHVTYFLKFD